MKQREAELKREIQNLRGDLENKKARMEVELKSRLAKDVAQLREELSKMQCDRELEISNNVIQDNLDHHNHIAQNPKPQKGQQQQRPSIKTSERTLPSSRKVTGNNSSAFLRELESIESDIRQLKSQVRIDDINDYNSEDTSTTLSDEEVLPMPTYNPTSRKKAAYATENYYDSPLGTYGFQHHHSFI